MRHLLGIGLLWLMVTAGYAIPATAAIASGFPFSFILLGMCYCLFKALRKEHPKIAGQ